MSKMRKAPRYGVLLVEAAESAASVLGLGIKVGLRSREFGVVCVIVLSLSVGVNEQV